MRTVLYFVKLNDAGVEAGPHSSLIWLLVWAPCEGQPLLHDLVSPYHVFWRDMWSPPSKLEGPHSSSTHRRWSSRAKCRSLSSLGRQHGTDHLCWFVLFMLICALDVDLCYLCLFVLFTANSSNSDILIYITETSFIVTFCGALSLFKASSYELNIQISIL